MTSLRPSVMDFTSEAEVPRSLLACHVCKRRKSKCDRSLPSCSTCLKSSQHCDYPGAAQKPGPKIGMTHRTKKRTHADVEASNEYSAGITGNTRLAPVSPTQYTSTSMKAPQSFHRRKSSLQPSGPAIHGSVSHPLDTLGLPSPASTIPNTPLYDATERKKSTLIEIIHPSHEPTTQPAEIPERLDLENQELHSTMTEQIIQDTSEALQISTNSYHYLISAYFENMMSFSLFHRPSFDTKLLKICSRIQRHTLLASMFSFSARFREGASPEQIADMPSPESFHRIATQLLNQALEECSDNAPPLCILQAMILTTFQQLAIGVRGRAWRSLGTCIRIAYELELHLVDQKNDQDQDLTISRGVELWVSQEERRRAWWALWEFDVFASSIRRLPTAIEWLRNETRLPVDDDVWFANKISPSCHLVLDPNQRWKLLEKSGNKSGRAWFIVINSLMRSAQSIWGTSRRSLQPTNKLKGDSTPISRSTEDAEIEMSMISDAICCCSMALPLSLTYRGEFLSFRASKYSAIKTSRQNDSDKYSIHIMKQLARFMVYHHRVFRSTGREVGEALLRGNAIMRESTTRGPNQAAWSRYLDAADDIIAVIRNSSSDHIQYVNPFLSSTIWLAAAAQVASRTFGPTVTNPKAVEANLDLLRLTFSRFVSFWDLSETLQDRLNTLESRLQNLISNEQAGALGSQQAELNTHGSIVSKTLTNTEVNRECLKESQRNDRIDDFSSASSYFPQESALSPSGIPTYDTPYSQPAAGTTFGGFQVTMYDNWDSFELEELLTYGYDGNGVPGLA